MLTGTDFAAVVAATKHAVRAMMSERERIAAVDFWQDTHRALHYLFDLSPESFRAVRWHAGWIVGEPPATYWHPIPPIDPDRFAAESGYADAVRKLPERFWIGEVENAAIPGALGVTWKGNVINHSTAKYQRVIRVLYENGLFERQRPTTLEIGAGYGGLAHHAGRLSNGRVVIVDLPETFLLSVPYIALNNPDKTLAVYGLDDFTLDADFVFAPNFALDRLSDLRFDAAINTTSMDEMSETEAIRYLDFIAKRLTGVFYSRNAERHPYNCEMRSLWELTETRFRVKSGPVLWANRKAGYSGVKEMIGRSHGADTST